MFYLDPSVDVFTKSKYNEEKTSFYYLLYLVHTLIFCILSYYLYFLKFSTPSQMLNFIFSEVTRKLSYLRGLNFLREKWLRGHTSWLHTKWLMCFRMWWQTFSLKMWVTCIDASRIMRIRFQYTLQFLWLIEHSWSPKITNFWGSR